MKCWLQNRLPNLLIAFRASVTGNLSEGILHLFSLPCNKTTPISEICHLYICVVDIIIDVSAHLFSERGRIQVKYVMIFLKYTYIDNKHVFKLYIFSVTCQLILNWRHVHMCISITKGKYNCKKTTSCIITIMKTSQVLTITYHLYRWIIVYYKCVIALCYRNMQYRSNYTHWFRYIRHKVNPNLYQDLLWVYRIFYILPTEFFL